MLIDHVSENTFYHKCYFKIVLHNFTSSYASEIWGNFEISRVVFMPNITYNSCYYLFIRHVFIFAELFRFVGEQIGFEVLVFGPAGPDIEPGRSTFLSILVFRISS